jgi:hypothetical protein
VWVPLERRGSPLYLCYSTPCLNKVTAVPISYFLITARSQVRLNVSIRIGVSRCCWQGQTTPLAMMLQKCTMMLASLSRLKCQPRDLVVNVKYPSSVRRCLSTAWVCIFDSSWQPHAFYGVGPHLSSNLAIRSKFPSLVWMKAPLYLISVSPVQNHQSYLTDLQHHATVDSYSLKPTKLSHVW